MNTTPTPQAAGPVDLLLLAGWPAGALLLPHPHPHRPGRGLR